MQIEISQSESQEQEERKDYNNKIVSIDYSLGLLRDSEIKDIRGCSSSNPWPVNGFNFLERSVISTQLWLHQIEYLTTYQTEKLIDIFANKINHCEYNQQLYIVYDSDLKLNLIFNSEIKWINRQPFIIRTIKIINYIDYLAPLAKISKSYIICTIIARKGFSTQHLLEAEIVSNKQLWRYYKETKEAYRNHNFKYFHHFDLYKAINYHVQKRLILSLNQFIHLEIVIVKHNYFIDINQYYSGQHQFTLPNIESTEFQLYQPHQIDYFGTIDKIITKFYPQQY